MGILDGKAIVVTGAGRGLGRAYAEHAAAAGAAVVVNDVHGAEEVASGIRETGGRALASPRSVADPGQAAAVIDDCVREFGALDGLVNNAAVSYHAAPWEDDDPARTRALVEVNILGTFYCGTAAAKVMHAQGRGAIVNAGSGSMLGQGRAAAYSASKGAVASMTFSWAADLAPHGVRVNGICPRAWTPMMEADPNAALRSNRDETPDRMAPLVTYLLSDLAAGVNGQLVRFAGDKLHIVRHAGIKEPVLSHETWTVDTIAAAFDKDLTPEIRSAKNWAV
ncbi:NAD(P)-dependent dehydrogenase, short-chain alcohol dehydrogenase family [Amycolatopsis xylanica]|uniref:NAD(P)-dependent dehydrogenase, short-chain alcohol dehydrogenase family n=1 Tax=Amycolatopsis xylanica TaxID=589385 RepID=A0A1H3P9K5_9PSEU|nr:SDR family oxidoreductase [Amycolatopsis xylanica]SDY97623.1 NAD(P)-dependent dehydrogenase, short-chain alcohol dehydrogenase family [Amycolatopsis xylanica]